MHSLRAMSPRSGRKTRRFLAFASEREWRRIAQGNALGSVPVFCVRIKSAAKPRSNPASNLIGNQSGFSARIAGTRFP